MYMEKESECFSSHYRISDNGDNAISTQNRAYHIYISTNGHIYSINEFDDGEKYITFKLMDAEATERLEKVESIFSTQWTAYFHKMAYETYKALEYDFGILDDAQNKMKEWETTNKSP